MTIEQKAQRYDEALKRAKKLYERGTITESLGHIFPELKESEDGRIKKEIITHCRNTRCVTEEGAERIAKWIAWLEKQGQTFTKKDVDDAYLKGVCDTKRELEKQGDKPQGKTALEAIKEEKVDNANKVEPKFRNGQWIVWQDKCYKVNYNGCGYELVDQDGLSTSLEYGTIDENAHIWDITKDAKDGDILCTYECDEPKIVFILKGTSMYPHFESDSKKGCLAPNDEDVKPATKEQCDLLFQKMKETGYEWDAEKKELKKIEQNPAWSEEDDENIMMIENRFSDLLEYIREDSSLTKHRKNTLKDDVIGYFKWIKSLKERCVWKPSKEQMDALDSTLQYSQVSHNSFEQLNSLFNDLKKLREE